MPLANAEFELMEVNKRMKRKFKDKLRKRAILKAPENTPDNHKLARFFKEAREKL